MSARTRHLSYCRIGDYVYAILPSCNRKMREVVADFAVPVEAFRPAYRVPDQQWPAFLDAVARLYPQWEQRRSIPAPPWAEKAAAQLDAERRTLIRPVD